MNLFRLLNTWLNKRAAKLENGRFGILAMYNAIQSCVGAIAVMKILQNAWGMFLMAVATALTIASNSVFIVQGSTKWCLILFYLSIVVNAIIIFV